ncbi:MAG: glycosyltransferase [Ferrovibrio sp.]
MHLAILLDERITDWEAKGEILPGYFNPADAFDQVTIIGLPMDNPGLDTIRDLSGKAQSAFISMGLDRKWLALALVVPGLACLKWALRPLLRQFAASRPDIIRAYGDGMAAGAAWVIGEALGIPYVVSLHTTPDPRRLSQFATPRDRLWRRLLRKAVRPALAKAGHVIAVYSPILGFLPPAVRDKTTVIPNVVAAGTEKRSETPDPDVPAADAALHVLWVGRLIPGRDPGPVVEAVLNTPDVYLTIVGDGPLRPIVQGRVASHPEGVRVNFIPSLPNSQLVARLAGWDVLAVRTDYAELAKPVMEAALAGLAVIVNREPSQSLEEYKGFPAIFVDATPASYAAAFTRLLNDRAGLRILAEDVRQESWRRWNPRDVALRAADVMRNVAEEHLES